MFTKYKIFKRKIALFSILSTYFGHSGFCWIVSFGPLAWLASTLLWYVLWATATCGYEKGVAIIVDKMVANKVVVDKVVVDKVFQNI